MIENGILNINKPQGLTSHDVVSKVRRTLGIKRVGHTGTLDPMATGVLPVCIGSATRIMEYLDMDFKTYRCTMMLGKVTDTQDIWGEILEERSIDGIDNDHIKKAFESFEGLIEQKPPMYSAVRVKGRRLYEYARAGEEVEVKSRRVYIRSLNIEEINLNEKSVRFVVECSKGTYIRTICRDVGEMLGCGAAMSALERTASGRFNIEGAVDLERLQDMEPQEAASLMVPADFPLVHFGQALVDADTAKKFVDGHHLPLDRCRIIREPEFKEREPEIAVRPEYREAYNIYKEDPRSNMFLGVAFYDHRYKKLVADKVLSRGDM